MPFTHINRRPTPHPHARIQTEPRAFRRSAQRATLLSRRQKKRLRDIAREGLAVLEARARKAREEEDLKVCWAFLREVDKYVPRVGCGGFGGEAGERRKEEVKGYMSWEEFKGKEEEKNYEADRENNGVGQSEEDEVEVSEDEEEKDEKMKEEEDEVEVKIKQEESEEEEEDPDIKYWVARVGFATTYEEVVRTLWSRGNR